ncbi:probable inactive receptor kinase At1g48480 [Miscanthus floridulus]|uniref:probable inactive receptor kinase At1g48480 n=1 Tax=Miscanthus floridulus TaxID=154761 RepID=UPI00345ACC9A
MPVDGGLLRERPRGGAAAPRGDALGGGPRGDATDLDGAPHAQTPPQRLSGALPADLASADALRNVFLNGNRLSSGFPQLNGSIPASFRSQLRSAFLGTGLCGGPLGPCPGEVSSSPAPAGQTSSPTPVPSGSGGGGGGGSSGGTNSGSGGESGHKSKKLSGGAIAGIAVGSALGAALLLFLLVCLCRRSGGTRTRSLEMPPPAPAPAVAAGGRKAPEMTSGAVVAPLTPIGHPNAPIGQSTSSKKLVFFGSAAAVARDR